MSEIIPDLIELGVDGLYLVQVRAKGMSPEKPAREFKNHITFVGGIDVRQLLRLGIPDEVRENVRRMKGFWGTGYVIFPSHEALLPDVPAENIEAMCDEAKK